MKVSQLTAWGGEINRKDYLIWGLILFAVKYNLDRLTALAFGRIWYFSDYFIQADKLAIDELTPDDKYFYLVLLLQSAPFIWFGTVLCVKRLRSAKLKTWWVIFFFIPFLNFILFVILSALPEQEGRSGEQKESYLAKLIPSSKYGSAFFAVGIVLLISILTTALLIRYLQEYGWSLFVGIPFFLGFGSVMIYGHNKRLQYKQALGVTLFSVLFFNLIIVILAFEGVLCLAMAFPIVLFIAWIGATIGYAIHSSTPTVSFNLVALPLLLIPILGWVESYDKPTPPELTVTSDIVVNASSQEVWDQLVAFSKIDEPAELLFKSGIAYPTHAEISGKGVGAIRKCNFTTGAFIEPITIWNEPNLLEFGVESEPAPMIEWSPYKNLQIPHLAGYFQSTKGQFKLVELPNGQTHLIGTTWYHHNIWPSSYWRLWSDFILHRIHMRVLNHIKNKAENT